MKYKKSFKRPFVVYRDPSSSKNLSWVRYIGNRVLRYEKNFLCAVTGQTGNGKSYACCKIGEEYSKMFGISFDPERDYFFYFKDLINSINDPEIQKEIPYGRFIIYDEMQAEANARDWQSKRNRRINKLLSIFRSKRYVLLFPTPLFQALDSQARKLLHAEFCVEGFDINNKITTVVPRALIGWNLKQDQPYRYKLMAKYKIQGKKHYGGKLISTWKLDIASDEILKPYLEKKDKYVKLELKNMNEELQDEVNESDKKTKVKFNEVRELYNQYGEDYITICEKLGNINPYTIEKYIQFIKKSIKARDTVRQ